MAILDYEEERTFTRTQLEKMPVIGKGKTINDYILEDGSELVVDTLDAGRCWVQYDRRRGLYRCADKKRGEAMPFERGWRGVR